MGYDRISRGAICAYCGTVAGVFLELFIPCSH